MGENPIANREAVPAPMIVIEISKVENFFAIKINSIQVNNNRLPHTAYFPNDSKFPLLAAVTKPYCDIGVVRAESDGNK